jgi:hypothetical protein
MWGCLGGWKCGEVEGYYMTRSIHYPTYRGDSSYGVGTGDTASLQ